MAWAAKYRGEAHPAADRHGRFSRHSPCWSCGADLGCARCSGEPEELLCMKGSGRQGGHFFGHGRLRGPVWATKAAFVQHGPFQGQAVADYPSEWAYEYERTATLIDADERKAGMEIARRLEIGRAHV